MTEAAHLFQAAFVWINLLSKHYKSTRIIYQISTHTLRRAQSHMNRVLFCTVWPREGLLLLILSLLKIPEPCPQIPSHPHNQRHFSMAYGTCSLHEQGEDGEASVLLPIEYLSWGSLCVVWAAGIPLGVVLDYRVLIFRSLWRSMYYWNKSKIKNDNSVTNFFT